MLKTIKLTNLPRATRMLRPFIAATGGQSTMLILVVLIAATASAAITSSNTSTTSNHTQLSSTKTSGADTKSSKSSTNGQSTQVTIVEQQQQQPTDLSSMYVQIPIAEPGDTGVPDGVQQTLTGSDSDLQTDSKATSWTGPWPKKFQIGYIKQSDLHQVLIESLKNDPFVSLSSPTSSVKSAPTSSSTQAPTTKKQSAGAKSQPIEGLMKQAQWANNGASYNQQQQMQRPQSAGKNMYPMSLQQGFRDPKMGGQIPFQMQRFQQQIGFNQQNFNHQKPMSSNNFGQQFQFAGFPSNSFKNQPMYTINNYPHQDQVDTMQMLQPQQFVQQSNRAPKSNGDYYSSWRPVTNGDKSEQASKAQPMFQTDYQSISDNFDDGFNMPSKDATLPATMNRHPMLNSYMSSDSTKGTKMSPSMVVGKSKQEPRSLTGKTDSKTSQQPVKGSSDSDRELSVNRRRSQSNSTTTTSTTTTASSSTTIGQETTSTVAPSSDESTTLAPNGTSTTTQSSTQTPTTTTTLASVSSTQNGETETQEPDSEVLDSDTDTPTSSDSASSTTASPLDGTSAQTQDSGESEVVTQGSGVSGTTTLPLVSGSGLSSSTTSTTTISSNREETTPTSSTESSSQSAKGGEVEGSSSSGSAKNLDSLSDEALLAASVRTGSEIAKMEAASLQKAANSSSNKRTRSSERVQAQSSGGRKSSSNKLITKKPSAGSARSGKQVGDVKGGAKESKAAKQTKRRPIGGVNKSKPTRMVQQSERLQQQPQVISMSAAQAQSTAQTLASLLLSRCMSSSNCAHLLDVCTTKQALIALPGSESAQEAISNNQSLAWSMPVGLVSSSIMSLTQALQADRVLKLFPQWKEAIENLVDHDTQTGYTLLLPSNEAIERLPDASVDLWLANSDLMSQIIDNHMIDSPELIEFAAGSAKTRVIKSKGLQVNRHRDKMVTINGKRLVYANQAAPSNGRIHVIDGILDWPLTNNGLGQAKLLDIMDTLKQCDKFDGFVTLAEGTGLTQILKQDGPMTAFVPSNEALRKIPDDELEVIKNNSTALKEFLMYHVANGSYFSQDLRDGQQIASILDMKPIQVGVRVDGCSRRLVEANTSPMRRPDIVAKNGVIHILDWYLTVRDNEWCDPIGRSPIASNTPSIASDRLQQLASEPGATYATRMIMPANHKPANGQLNEGPIQSVVSNHKSSLINGQETNNIIVSATPLVELNRASAA